MGNAVTKATSFHMSQPPTTGKRGQGRLYHVSVIQDYQSRRAIFGENNKALLPDGVAIFVQI